MEAEEATELSIKYEIAVVPLFLFFKARLHLVLPLISNGQHRHFIVARRNDSSRKELCRMMEGMQRCVATFNLGKFAGWEGGGQAGGC